MQDRVEERAGEGEFGATLPACISRRPSEEATAGQWWLLTKTVAGAGAAHLMLLLIAMLLAAGAAVMSSAAGARSDRLRHLLRARPPTPITDACFSRLQHTLHTAPDCPGQPRLEPCFCSGLTRPVQLQR